MNLIQSLPEGVEGKRCACGAPGRHNVNQVSTCCECYVRMGFPPADWHPDCVRVFESEEERRAAVIKGLRDA